MRETGFVDKILGEFAPGEGRKNLLKPPVIHPLVGAALEFLEEVTPEVAAGDAAIICQSRNAKARLLGTR
jgi:hypothetical protein